MEIIGAVLAAAVPALMVWIHQDGPGRMYAQFVASSDVGAARRKGAMEVLDQTKYLRGRTPQDSPTPAVRSTPRRRGRPNPPPAAAA